MKTLNERVLRVLRTIKGSTIQDLDRLVDDVEAAVAKEKAQARKLWRRPGVRVALVIVCACVLLALGAVLG